MSGKILRVAVLGQGRSGFGIHFDWLKQAPDKFKVVAVADSDPARCREAKELVGARTYGDYTELLKDQSLELDLVVNALPSLLHPKGALAALSAGHHVVCEKPLARTVKEFDRMVETAKQHKRLLLPFQNSRFCPIFRKIQEVLASGCLGRPVQIRLNWSGYGRRWDWQTLQAAWAGNLLNTGPHPVDQAITLFGEKTPKVFCRMVSDNPWGDSDNHTSLTLYGGREDPIIEVCVSSFQPYSQGEKHNICGQYGGLTSTADGLKWKYFDPAKAPEHAQTGGWSDERKFCSEELPWVEETWTEPKDGLVRFSQMSRDFYANAYDIIVNGAPRVVTLEQVRRQIAVMEESHRQNKMPKKFALASAKKARSAK